MRTDARDGKLRADARVGKNERELRDEELLTDFATKR